MWSCAVDRTFKSMNYLTNCLTSVSSLLHNKSVDFCLLVDFDPADSAKMTSLMPLTTSLALLLLPGLSWSAQPLETVHIDLSAIAVRNSRLNGSPYLSLSPKSLKQCAEICKRRPRCLSFNFRMSNLICELNDKSSSSTGASLVTENGMMFSDSSSWPGVSQLNEWARTSLGNLWWSVSPLHCISEHGFFLFFRVAMVVAEIDWWLLANKIGFF